MVISNRSERLPAFVAAVLASLALAGCDSGRVNQDSQSANTTALETLREFVADGSKEETSAKTQWAWRDGDLEGWTVNLNDATISWPDGGGISLTAPLQPASPDLFLRSPDLAIVGKDYSRVMVDIEAVVPAPQLDFALYYETRTHGESFDYRGGPLDGSELSAGERRVLVYDMINQAAGGSDWSTSAIQRIRFDLPQGAGSQYVVHALMLCRTDSANCD